MRRFLGPVAVTAVVLIYLSNGQNYSALAARFPEVAGRIGMSEGALGLARTGFTMGMVVSMIALVGWLVRRFRPATIAAISLAGYALSMLLAALAPSPVWFAAAMALGGLCNSPLDVTQATLAIGVEKRRGWRSGQLVALAEGTQGVGLATGAGLSWLWAGRTPVWVETSALLVFAVGAGILAFVTLRQIGASPGEARQAGTVAPPPERMSRRLWWLAGLSFVALFVEAALTNWLALFFHNDLGLPLSAAGIGVTAFAVTLVAGRFLGAALLRWSSPAVIVRWGGVAILAGTALIASAPSPLWATIGAACAGAGVANVHPVVLASVGAGEPDDRRTAARLTQINRIGYIGIAADGLLLGAVAEVFSLRVALAAAGALALLLVWRGGLLTAQAPGDR